MLALATVETFKNQIIHTDLLTLCASLPAQSVDMILCDLPYGVTAAAWDEMIPFEPMWAGFKRVIKPDGAIVLTASQPFTSKLVCSNLEMFRYEWVWQKSHATRFLDANRRPLNEHENILIFSQQATRYFPVMRKVDRKPFKKMRSRRGNGVEIYRDFEDIAYCFSGEVYPRTILKYSHDPDRTITAAHRPDKPLPFHSTRKPIALFEYLIKTYTRPGEIVLDPCVGSGTTALAAYKTGRDFIAGDITESYVQIARERLTRARLDQPIQVAPGLVQRTMFEAK